MNEVKKWLKKGAAAEVPTASLLVLEARQSQRTGVRHTVLGTLPKFLRDYDSEYHYLFNLVLRFTEGGDEFAYLMPNILRKLCEVFLAFAIPGPDGLESKLRAVFKLVPESDEGRISALNRLVQVESHGDSLDDLLGFSSMTLEESRDASNALLGLIAVIVPEHDKRMRRLCA